MSNYFAQSGDHRVILAPVAAGLSLSFTSSLLSHLIVVDLCRPGSEVAVRNESAWQVERRAAIVEY